MAKQRLFVVVALLFVISGGTGLVYQIAWFKYLSLFLGNSTYAQTVVLATFMGGLAIGAWAWGRRADRAERPLAVYAVLELGVGVYCLLYPDILEITKSLFVSLVGWTQLRSDSLTVLSLKFVVSLVTLLVPTILMGGTLPVLVRAVSHNLEESGRNVAILYFLNSLGAVIGSTLGGFFLMPIIGLKGSVYGAAAVNIAIGLAVMLLSRMKLVEDQASRNVGGIPERSFSDWQVSVAIAAAGVSGAASMIYEIGWVRLLIPILGSSTYSFSVMLIAFISGITLGSWIVSFLILRVRNLFRLLAVCQLGVVLSLIATFPLYGRLPYYFWHLGSLLQRSDASYPVFLTVEFMLCFAVMMLPTVFLGMNLPVASRIATKSISVLGRSVGTVFSVNTAGTVLGSLVGGLVLIPAFGVTHALEIGLALNVILTVMIWLSDTSLRAAHRIPGAAGAAALAALYVLTASNWSQSVMLSGVFRMISRGAAPPATFSAYSGMYTSQRRLYYKEGSTATVAVVEHGSGASRQLLLIVNGKADASSRGDLPSQVLIGQLPMVLHPRPERACVIGLGSGVTLGSVLTHDVKSVDCAEISPEVVEASAFFDSVSNHPLADPRVSLYVDDALSFLKLTPRQYDVIVSEPTNPWIAGVGNLYTTEFLALCKERLGNQGLMVQWFHLYEMDDAVLKLAVRTFASVFPCVTIWQSLATDIIMVGSSAPMELNIAHLNAKLEREAVRRDLERIQITTVPGFLSLQVCSDSRTREYSGSGEVNTEDRPLLEYSAPKAFFVNRGTVEFYGADERMHFNPSQLMLQQYVGQSPLNQAQMESIGLFHVAPLRGNLSFGYSLLQAVGSGQTARADLLSAMADAAERLGKTSDALDYRRRLANAQPNDPAALAGYAWMQFSLERPGASMLTAREWTKTEELLLRAIALVGDTVDTYRMRLGNYYYEMMMDGKAVENYRRALEIRERREGDTGITQDAILLQLARALARLGDREQAVAYAAQARLANPDNDRARQLLETLLRPSQK